ncbi:MAG: CAP domain-containing protein [Actinomycetota bacterium]
MSYCVNASKRWVRRSAALATGIGICVIAVIAPASTASASYDAQSAIGGVRVNAAEARMFRLVNASRHHAGLAPLRLAPGYTDVARRWSRAMAVRHTLVHNPRLVANVTTSGGATWRAIGENVAYGYRPDVVYGMYMNSPPHRANILGPGYRYIGVGWVQTAAGPGYTTLVFSSSYSSSYGPTRVPPGPCTVH